MSLWLRMRLMIVMRGNPTLDAGERHHETIQSTKKVEKQAIDPRVPICYAELTDDERNDKSEFR
jgi:hypothetical protein